MYTWTNLRTLEVTSFLEKLLMFTFASLLALLLSIIYSPFVLAFFVAARAISWHLVTRYDEYTDVLLIIYAVFYFFEKLFILSIPDLCGLFLCESVYYVVYWPVYIVCFTWLASWILAPVVLYLLLKLIWWWLLWSLVKLGRIGVPLLWAHVKAENTRLRAALVREGKVYIVPHLLELRWSVNEAASRSRLYALTLYSLVSANLVMLSIIFLTTIFTPDWAYWARVFLEVRDFYFANEPFFIFLIDLAALYVYFYVVRPAWREAWTECSTPENPCFYEDVPDCMGELSDIWDPQTRYIAYDSGYGQHTLTLAHAAAARKLLLELRKPLYTRESQRQKLR